MINKYAAGLSQEAAQIRLQRKANGFKDTPPKVTTPPVATPTGELTIDLGAVYNLFGDTEVKGAKLRSLDEDGIGRDL